MSPTRRVYLLDIPHTISAGFLRDVAASRRSSNKFGSALDFRNVIENLPLRGNL